MIDYNKFADKHLNNIKMICDKIDMTSFKPVPRKIVTDWYIKKLLL